MVGAGLLGASVGLGLAGQGVRTWVRDASPTTEAVAADIGAGTSESRRIAEVGAQQARAEMDPSLVVVATPPDVAGAVAAQALADFPDAVVIDVASVKVPVLEAVLASGQEASRYVGNHPMAGREKSGPVAARAELFTSRPWVVCEHPDASEAALAASEALARDLGAVVTRMEPEEHDRTVALISHVPQVMSSLLASRLQQTPLEALALAGQGLRDTTRIAASDPGLWVQILSGNAAPVVQALREVRTDLDRLIGTLEHPTAEGARLDLAQLMSEGNAGVSRIPGKHGGAPKAFSELTILVDDTPGQIAKVLTEIGEIGVNLEDLRMEHSQGQPVGMVGIAVNPNAREELAAELTRRGWKIVE